VLSVVAGIDMADVPEGDEKQGPTKRAPLGARLPRWAWALVALCLVGVIALSLGRRRGRRDTPAIVDPTTAGVPQVQWDGAVGSPLPVDQQGVIWDVNLYGATRDKQSLLNRPVQLLNASVARVLSDRVFTIPSGSSEIFAMLDEGLNNGPPERRVTIAARQNVDLQGSFRSVTGAETEPLPAAVTGDAGAELRAQPIYLRVTLVRAVVLRPLPR
jgi:hypothetical protein